MRTQATNQTPVSHQAPQGAFSFRGLSRTSERTFYIYCHIAPNGKRYVGQTRMEPEKRWQNGRGYSIQPYFKRAIDKYGWDNFEHCVLCSVSSKEYADYLERWFIRKYDTTNPAYGYNISDGGNGPYGVAWDDDRKKAFSELMSGSGNPMFGKHHSQKSIALMSQNRSKAPFTEEMREKNTAVLLESNRKRMVPVRQLDANDSLIAVHMGITEAARATSISYASIYRACSGKANTAGGFRWEFVDEERRRQAEELRTEKAMQRNRKPSNTSTVIQCDQEGNQIAVYASLSEAERKTGLKRDRIGDCCHGGLESYGGYVWKFADQRRLVVDETAVIQLDVDGKEIARFDSLASASEKVGIPRYQIRNCCRGKQRTAHGFKWEYLDARQKKAKPRVWIVQLNQDGDELARFPSLTEAERSTGHDRHRIAECCQGKRDSYRGVVWMYGDPIGVAQQPREGLFS